MNPASVLVCDDFRPFREYLVSTLRKWDFVRVVCEVWDGQDAVNKAGELKPDLILLDMGLPKLNGIAAAYQIRKFVPESKIIFVTQECSAEVVREAMDLGASGYVQKIQVGIDLQVAIDAVLDGG